MADQGWLALEGVPVWTVLFDRAVLVAPAHRYRMTRLGRGGMLVPCVDVT